MSFQFGRVLPSLAVQTQQRQARLLAREGHNPPLHDPLVMDLTARYAGDERTEDEFVDHTVRFPGNDQRVRFPGNYEDQ